MRFESNQVGSEGSTAFVILRVLMLIARMAADQLFIKMSRLHEMQANSRDNLLHRSADCSEHSPLLTCMFVLGWPHGALMVGWLFSRGSAATVAVVASNLQIFRACTCNDGRRVLYHTDHKIRRWIVQVGNIYLGDLF